MSNSSRRKFTRPSAKLNYKKRITIFTEGNETEPQYFKMFKENNNIIVEIKSSKHKSHPSQVLKRAENYLRKEKLRSGDEVWLVVDVDNRPKEEFQTLIEWSDQCDQKATPSKEIRSLAISNPNFEYWLLSHFENGHDVKNSDDCRRRLLKHLPSFKKNHVETAKFEQHIDRAIKHAKEKHLSNIDQDCFDDYGTTVYLLVGKLRKG